MRSERTKHLRMQSFVGLFHQFPLLHYQSQITAASSPLFLPSSPNNPSNTIIFEAKNSHRWRRERRRSTLELSPALPNGPESENIAEELNKHNHKAGHVAFSEEHEQASSSSSSLSSSRGTEKTAVTWFARRAAITDIQRSTDLGSSLARLGWKLQEQDLNIILRYFGKLKRWKDVCKLFDWMQKHGKVNVASYSSFIKFMGQNLNPIKALELYNSIEDEQTRNNVSVCNAVLCCLVRNGKFESCMKLFEQMKKGGLTPDIVTYSTLISGCIKIKAGYAKSLLLIQELKDNGLHMDSVMYGTLLAVCASNNLCKEAEDFFQQMKNEGFSPNLFHYSSLLNAYSVEGNHTNAERLVKAMKFEGLVPNKVILITLLKVYVRGGLFEKSRELLSELEVLGHAEEEMPYCLLMDGLAKAGNVHEAQKLFEEMKKKNVKPDGFAHSIMISAFCRSGMLEEAKQLAREFEASHGKYDLVMSNTLLRAYCRGGEMEYVMGMLRKMDEMTISPDSSTFHILIKYFCKERLYQLAYQTVEDMHRKGHQLDEELCSSLILQLGNAGAAPEAFSVYVMLRTGKRTVCKSLHEKILNILVAGDLLKEAYVVMKDNGEVISRRSLDKFLISFVESGNINRMNDVLKAFHGYGHRIDQEVLGMAVSRYIGEPEKKELLLHLLQWMTGQGYVVDSSSRNLLLKNSHMFGRQVVAEMLSEQYSMSKKLRTMK